MLKFDAETTRLLEIAYQGGDVRRRRMMAFDALQLSPGDTVVDIGCGNGLLTEEIARAVGPSGRIIGVDPSSDMRAAAENRCAAFQSVRIADGLADKLPVQDAGADKAVAVQVLEYLTDIPAAIAESFRILRPGGRFVAIDAGLKTLDWFTEDSARMHRVLAAWDHHYAEERVAALWPNMARAAGYVAIDVTPFPCCDVTLRPDGIAFMLMHLMSRYAVENGHMGKAETDAWFDEQVELARQGRFFFSVTFYLMSAIKP